MRKGILAAALAGLLMVGPAPVHAKPKPPDKIVYLTFDDGPDWGNDPRLLKVLRRAQVPATFFVVGSIAAGNHKAVQRLALAGHAIGNHSWSHADLTTLSAAGVGAEVARTQHALGGLGGKCVRPPYGAVNSTVVAEIAKHGMRTVMWDVDPMDWAHRDSAYIAGHVLSRVGHRSVVLLHDGGGPRAATISAVKQIIPGLRARGFEFRTVPACRVDLRGEVLDGARIPRPTNPQPVAPRPDPTPVVP